MNEYNYKFFKTTKKTAKENNLESSIDTFNNKNLFDFSLLDTMEIPEREKEVIKKWALKYVSAANKESMYGAQLDNFHTCNGIALYHVHKVFSVKSGKLLYRIFTLAKIKHSSGKRNSVYDRYYDSTDYKESNGCHEPMNDIEL